MNDELNRPRELSTWARGVVDGQVRDAPGPRHSVVTAGVVGDWGGYATRYDSEAGRTVDVGTGERHWREITPRRFITVDLLRALLDDATDVGLVLDGDTVVRYANAYWVGQAPKLNG